MKNKQKFLKFKDLYELANELRFSNGAYERLFRELQETPKETQKTITEQLKKVKITTELGLILWIEN